MICQTESVKTKTGALPAVEKRASRSAHAPFRLTLVPEVDHRLAWSPANAGPFMVPVTRWVE